jgi:N-acetylmuramic acid 6-phosphate etherase
MRITEKSSRFTALDQMGIREVLEGINEEDQTVPTAVQKAIPQIEVVVSSIYERMKQGGRLFYIGAGTSGRLGIVDASECPPTFGVPHGKVVGLIAGGDAAIRKAVEFAEDDEMQAWKDIQVFHPTEKDTVIGIAASGTTPYVIGGLRDAKMHGLLTASISCNPDAPLSKQAELPIEVVVGPEFLTGSTRMKAGTAQKLVLNMISTTLMIKLGHVKGNKMVDMQLSNQKLIERGTMMLMDELQIDEEKAKTLLLNSGSVRKAIEDFYHNAPD